MQLLSTLDPDFEKRFGRVVNARREADSDVTGVVQDILRTVKNGGEKALVDYTQRFDGYALGVDADWSIPPERCAEAYDALETELREALDLAAARIRAYHEAQLPENRDYTDDAGVRLGAIWRPVDAAGLYVPGGRAAYPSSLLMNAIPAKVAGVERIVVVTPTPKGQSNPLVLAAAHIAGIDEIWRVGGAQAIAALAYGTDRIRPVDVITGPGNAFVAEAKRQVGFVELRDSRSLVTFVARGGLRELLPGTLVAFVENFAGGRRHHGSKIGGLAVLLDAHAKVGGHNRGLSLRQLRQSTSPALQRSFR